MELIKPLMEEMLVEPVEKKDVLVMDGERKLYTYGKVLAIGPEVKYVQVGDYIGFAVWGLNHNVINEKKYYFVPEIRGIGLHKIDPSLIV